MCDPTGDMWIKPKSTFRIVLTASVSLVVVVVDLSDSYGVIGVVKNHNGAVLAAVATIYEWMDTDINKWITFFCE